MMMVLAPRQANTMTVLDKPRVISEIKKSKKKLQTNGNFLDGKPRIYGELAVGLQGQPCWQTRHVEVRDGSLVVYSASGRPELRLPLRRLNLQPAASPRAFCLVRDNSPPLATFQAGSQREYELWVKTLAVELMRQTPLEAIRFLDILGITATIATSRGRQAEHTGAVKRGLSEDSVLRVPPPTRMFESDSDPEEDVTALILRCQQVDNFVSVREKRHLFEALCRRGRRLAQSTDNLAGGGAEPRRPKRARSLHDLSRCSVAVRDICRYFEQRGRQQGAEEPRPERDSPSGGNAYLSRRRVQRGERRLARLKQLAADSEEAIWRLQEEMAAIDADRDKRKANTQRSKGLYAALERRLSEEEARLGRLQEEAARVLKEIEVATSKFETAVMRSTEQLESKN